MISSIPISKKEISIESLGFYEFNKCLSCIGKGLDFIKVFVGDQPSEQRVNKQQIVGIIFHNLIDKARELSNKKELLEFASDLIKEQEAKHTQFLKDKKLGSIKSWSDVTRAIQISFNYLGRSLQSGNNEKRPKKLVTKDSRFKGVPDYYCVIDNVATVVEYKSTSIFNDNKPKKDYVNQLKFYCSLILDNFEECQQFECALESLGGAQWKMILSKEEVQEYSNYLNSKYDEFLKKVSDDNIYNFSDENCEYCEKKIICDLYKQKCHEIESDRDDYIFRSKYLGDSIIGNRRMMKFEDGMISAPEKFPLASSMKVGTVYHCYNLYFKNKQFLWGVNSGLFKA